MGQGADTPRTVGIHRLILFANNSCSDVIACARLGLYSRTNQSDRLVETTRIWT